MKSLKGKKLLVLGGSASNVQLVRYAQQMGAYVYVADNLENRPGKKIADEAVMISCDDYQALKDFIISNKIDGISTGAGEWNVINSIHLAKEAGLNYYANYNQWQCCQDKRHFKDLCKKYGVPTVPEFNQNSNLKESDFPVIVKPVDGCSSRGIKICHHQDELKDAVINALALSSSSDVIIEKYIDNGSVTIDAKYVVIDGNYYLEAIGDRYVLEKGLITALSYYPSHYIDIYMKKIHPYVKAMFDSIGFRNGVFFFQAIPDGDDIYVYEMGLRVSGGMIYDMTEAAGGNNALKMLIYYTLTGKMCEKEDIAKIDPNLHNHCAATIALPLRLGKIDKIIGMKEVQDLPGVVNVTQYYDIGHTCMPNHINTLDQLFARIMIVESSHEALTNKMKEIRKMVIVKDENGNDLINWTTFDKKVLTN